MDFLNYWVIFFLTGENDCCMNWIWFSEGDWQSNSVATVLQFWDEIKFSAVMKKAHKIVSLYFMYKGNTKQGKLTFKFDVVF